MTASATRGVDGEWCAQRAARCSSHGGRRTRRRRDRGRRRLRRPSRAAPIRPAIHMPTEASDADGAEQEEHRRAHDDGDGDRPEQRHRRGRAGRRRSAAPPGRPLPARGSVPAPTADAWPRRPPQRPPPRIPRRRREHRRAAVAGPSPRPTRSRLAPSTSTPPSGTAAGEATGSAPIRPVTRPASWTKRTVPSSSTSSRRVVRLEGVVGERRRRPTATGRRRGARAGGARRCRRRARPRRRRSRRWPARASAGGRGAALGDGSLGRRGATASSPAAVDDPGRCAGVSWRPTARPSSSSGRCGSTPEASASSPTRSSPERGATVTRRPAGPSMSTVGTDRSGHALPGGGSQGRTERRSRHRRPSRGGEAGGRRCEIAAGRCGDGGRR